jgi:hypothetical protein
VWSSRVAQARLRPDAVRVCPEQDKNKSRFSKEPREPKKQVSSKKTYRCRGEDQLIERDAPTPARATGCCVPRPCSHPRCRCRTRRRPPTGCRQARGSGRHALCTLQQGHARVLLGLLDLWGGSPCRAIRGNVLLKGRGGLARRRNLFRSSSDRTGRRRPRLSDNTLRRVGHRSSSCRCDFFYGLGQGRTLVLSGRRWHGRNRGRLRTGRGLLENFLRRMRCSRGAEPLALSYWRSA